MWRMNHRVCVEKLLNRHWPTGWPIERQDVLPSIDIWFECGHTPEECFYFVVEAYFAVTRPDIGRKTK
jgi:hypothetical protein